MPLIPYAGKDADDHSGWTRGRPKKAGFQDTPRNRAILRRHNAGHTHIEIAADYGMTRERVRQLVEAMGGKPRRGPQKNRSKA